MDVIQDWATFLAHQASLAQLKPVYALVGTAKAYLVPLIDHVSTNPDLASVALLLIVLLVSLKIVNMLYRAVMFWITLALRLAFWGSVALAGLYVWSRGMDQTLADVRLWTQYWAGFWSDEYRRYQDQVDAARAWQRDQQPVGAAYGGGKAKAGW